MICFTGKSCYTVDSKRRVNIPASAMSELYKEYKTSEEFDESDIIFHITRGPNDCLFIYPREVFMKKAVRLNMHFGSRGTDDDEQRRYFLETMSEAHPVRCDQQGRITVPQEHLNYAKISGEVIVIGAFDHLEFWNPEVYDQFISTSEFSSKDRVKRFGWVEREPNGDDTPKNISHSSLSE